MVIAKPNLRLVQTAAVHSVTETTALRTLNVSQGIARRRPAVSNPLLKMPPISMCVTNTHA